MTLTLELTGGREAKIELPAAPLDRTEAAELVREFLLLATVVSSFHDGPASQPYRAMRAAVEAYLAESPDEELRNEIAAHVQHLGEPR